MITRRSHLGRVHSSLPGEAVRKEEMVVKRCETVYTSLCTRTSISREVQIVEGDAKVACGEGGGNGAYCVICGRGGGFFARGRVCGAGEPGPGREKR